MSNHIILKKSSVGAKVPVAGDLAYGELALNYADGKLYFKNSSNAIQSFSNDSNNASNVTLTGTQTLTNKTIAFGSNTISGTTAQFNTALTDGDFATLAGTETLTNKTLTSPSLSGTVALTSTTLLSINGSTGSSGQFLARGPTGLTWTAAPSPALSTLSDVAISGPTAQQVLTYTGSAWINADSNAVVASAVFATSQSDLGYVYDGNVTITEELGTITEIANSIYDLGVLSFTGIISLNNIDQSIKSDYLGYSIIFGF